MQENSPRLQRLRTSLKLPVLVDEEDKRAQEILQILAQLPPPRSKAVETDRPKYVPEFMKNKETCAASGFPECIKEKSDIVSLGHPDCKIISKGPHTIDISTLMAFEPSPEAIALKSEQHRAIEPEKLNYDIFEPPTLSGCCIEPLEREYERLLTLEETPRLFSNIIPTELSLEIVIPTVDYEYYWKRRYEKEFGIITYLKRKDWNWKRIYLERYLRKIVELARPQYLEEYEMDKILTLLSPYVQTLRVTQLQYWTPPCTMDEADLPEVWPDDHIEFEPIFKICQNLEEVEIVYGMNDVGMEYDKRMQNVSVNDCVKLGRALLLLKQLKIFRVRKSKLGDLHCQALVKSLLKNKTLVEFSLADCKIGDNGALCVAELIRVHPTLENIILRGNLIGGKGGEGLGWAIVQENCCPLKSLDIRMNPLKNKGAVGLMRGLARSTKPEKINLAACQFETMTTFIFGDLLRICKCLNWIDISNNNFGELGGEALVYGLYENPHVRWLDVRGTNITNEQKNKLGYFLRRNNKELRNPTAKKRLKRPPTKEELNVTMTRFSSILRSRVDKNS